MKHTSGTNLRFEMVLGCILTGSYHKTKDMRRGFLPTIFVSRAHGHGRRTDEFNLLPLQHLQKGRWKPKQCLRASRNLLKTHKAGNINKLSSCASPLDFHRWRTPPRIDKRHCLCHRSLTRLRRRGLRAATHAPQASESGDFLLLIRELHQCAGPSVNPRAIASQKGTQGGYV